MRVCVLACVRVFSHSICNTGKGSREEISIVVHIDEFARKSLLPSAAAGLGVIRVSVDNAENAVLNVSVVACVRASVRALSEWERKINVITRTNKKVGK